MVREATNAMNEGPRSAGGDFAGIEDVWVSAQQILGAMGMPSNPTSPLSFLQTQADPSPGPRLEIHRGRQRRLSVLSPPEPVPRAEPAVPPSGPTAGQVKPITEALTPIAGALLSALREPRVQQLLARFLSGGGLAAALTDLLHSPEQAARSTLTRFLGLNVDHATLNEPNQTTGEVSTAELREILNQRSAVVFDSRTRLEYAIGHIPGALTVAPKPGVPMSLYVSDAAEIARIVPDKASAIVLYCNGSFCGKSRRLADELVQAGYTNVRRYQLGTPVWRALVGMMVIELAGVHYVLEGDRTAAFIDARGPEEFALGSLPVARNVPLSDVIEAKDDGRLPMDDFNTRVIVFGRDGAQASAVAEALVQNGFNNVKYFAGTFSSLLTGLLQSETATRRGPGPGLT
jgi:rhodanese-related sulfurtransferase